MNICERSINSLDHHTVPELEKNIRFSDYAIGKFEMLPSRKSVKKAILSGRLEINGKPASTGTWVKEGMKISLKAEDRPEKIYSHKLEIVYEDKYLAVVNKPAGLSTSGNEFKTLENAIPFNLTTINEYTPRPIHRLDRATSGMLIVARSPEARSVLGEMLKNGEINKTYTAIVMGLPANEGEIKLPIETKSAVSTYQVIDSITSKKYALIKLTPITGRTHQLRIHCAESGFPILGDSLYGNKKGPRKGLFLCASQLDFQHPILNKTLSLSIKLPNKFTRFWQSKKEFKG